MKKTIIARAWKDPHFRAQLSQEDRDKLPRHPSGLYEVEEELLSSVAGGLATSGSEGWACTISGECGGGNCCFWPISR